MPAAAVVELLLQRLDVGHRLERRVLELLDVLARGVDLFPRRGVLLLVLHLHELPLILLEQLLLVGELAVDAAAFLRQRCRSVAAARPSPRSTSCHSRSIAANDSGLLVSCFSRSLELRQDCLQLPKFFNVLIQQLPPKTKKAFLVGTPVRVESSSVVAWDTSVVQIVVSCIVASGGSTRIRTWDLPVMSR